MSFIFICSWKKGAQLFKQNQTSSFFFYCLQSGHTLANLDINYRLPSILSIMSKIYEIPFVNQMNEHFINIFSKYQCGFREIHGVHFSNKISIFHFFNHKNIIFSLKLVLFLNNFFLRGILKIKKGVEVGHFDKNIFR